MIALLTHLEASHWLIGAVVLLIAEMLLPGCFLLWFGVGAAVTGLLLSVLHFSWQIQWLCFALVSIASILVVRRYRGRSPGEIRYPDLNRRSLQYVGRRYTLSEPIVDGYGRLNVDDTVWKVSGEDAPVGTRVRVVGVDGTVLKVERI